MVQMLNRLADDDLCGLVEADCLRGFNKLMSAQGWWENLGKSKNEARSPALNGKMKSHEL
jgi:hypothetical protein